MKKLPALLFTGVLLLSGALSAATFEGTVTMKITGPKNAPQEMKFSLKEGFSRVDVATGQQGMTVGMIMNQATQEMTILMDQQKMYMVRAMPKPSDVPTADKGPSAPSDVTVERTTITEKILGYDCVKLISTNKGVTAEMWVTDQLGTFMGMGGGGGGPMGGGNRGGAAGQAWEQALRGKPSFPLRVVTSKEGKENFRMEATSVDKQSLPDSVFQPPADYQKLDMGNMMRGMVPGGGRPSGG